MISVVIPAFNEEKTISRVLRSLSQQKTTKPFEVILVDNNSTDATVDVAKTFTGKIPLRIISENKKGRGSARSRGFAVAKGSIILSTDADTIVPENWIDALTDRLTGASAVAVTGPCEVSDCGTFTGAIVNSLQPVAMVVYRILFGHYWLSGFNFAIYKDAYEQSGGFNRSLNSMEDIDLGFRVRKTGRISFYPEVRVVCHGRRFHQGIIPAVYSYLKPFAKYLLSPDSPVELSDIR